MFNINDALKGFFYIVLVILVTLIFLLFGHGSFASTYIKGPALIEDVTTTATAAGTTTLTNASQTNQVLTGSTTQTVKLPNATTLPSGRRFYITNRSTGLVTVQYSDASAATTILANMQKTFIVRDVSTAIGVWDISNINVSGGGVSGFTSGSVIYAATDGTLTQDNSNFFWDATNHRLGLGTTSPTNILSLSGNSAQEFWMERHTTSNTAGNALTIASGGATSGATDKAGGNLVLQSGVPTGTGSSDITFQTYPAGTTGTTDGTIQTSVTIKGSGNVGIGTATPNAQGANTHSRVLSLAGDGTLVNANGRMELINPRANGSLATGDDAGRLGWTMTNNSGSNALIGQVTGALDGAGGANGFGGKMIWSLAQNNVANSLRAVMTMKESGNVGIGVATPANLLDVNGGVAIGTFAGSAGITNGLVVSGAVKLGNLGTGIVHSDSSGNLTSSAVALGGADVSGTLGVGNGGTGQVTLTSHGVLIGNTTSGINATAAGSAGQVLQSGGAAADPVYSTATYPATTTINQLLYSSSTSVVGGLATANNGVLITSSGGVPSISSTIPNATQLNITALGTVATGVWNGTAIAIANGGTGQTAKTAAFDALQPMTTSGDIIYGGTSGTGTRLAKGSDGQVLTLASGLPSWAATSAKFFASGQMTGANYDLGVAGAGTYGEMSNASMTLTPDAGSSAIGVMCSGTNAATAPSTSATTCAAGSESNGINAALPRAGTYRVCVDFSAYADGASSSNLRFSTLFQIVETPTNAQTITTGTPAAQLSRNFFQIATVALNDVSPITLCRNFNYGASGTKGYRLFYNEVAVASVNSELILSDNSNSRAVYWSIKEL